MSNTTVIIIAVVVAFIALVAFKVINHQGAHKDVENLKKVITEIFNESEKTQLTSQEFLQKMQEKTGVSYKIALTLLGKARLEGLISVNDHIVELIK